MAKWLFWLLFPALCLGAEPSSDLESAIRAYREKRYAEAVFGLEQLQKVQPDNPEVAFYLGRTLRRLKRLDEAVRSLERATQLAPGNADYFLGLGDAYGAVASARRSFFAAVHCRQALERAVELAPQSPDARVALIEFYRRAPGIAGGGTTKAYAQIDALRAFEPRLAARLLIELQLHEKRYEEAFSTWRDARSQSQPDPVLAVLGGRIALQSGTHLDEGISNLEEQLSARPAELGAARNQARVILAQLYVRKSNPAAARRQFEAVLAEEPGHPEAKRGLESLPR